MAAPKIQIKRSAVPGKEPTTSQLELGELAINTFSGNIFLKKSVEGTESVVKFSAAIDVIDDTSTDAVRYLLFSDSTSGILDDVNVSSTKLTFNPSSGNFGIGTSNPESKLTVSGDIQILDSGAFSTTIQTQTPTANRVITYPDATGTLALVPGSTNQLVYNSNGALSASLNLLFDGTTLTSSALSVTGSASVSGDLTVNTNTSIVGNLTVDTNTLYVDSTNNRVGVGTDQPSTTLDVRGTVNIGTVISTIPYDNLNSGTLSFEGSAGQLFSITNNLTSGSIFSVNDLSGIPSIDVDADGTVQIAPYGGNTGIGVTTPAEKLEVDGNIKTSGSAIINYCELASNITNVLSSTSQFVADTFSITSYRTTKYLIEVRELSTSNFYSSEILLMHDGTDVYITEYGTLQTAVSPVSSIDADINSGNVRLLITPTTQDTTTKISRISLVA